jgi:hypothetical protein
MSDYSVYQLKTIILLKHLNNLNAIWKDKVVPAGCMSWTRNILKTKNISS